MEKDLKESGINSVLHLYKEDIEIYLTKAGFSQELIHPIMNGYTSAKYKFKGIKNIHHGVLLRLRFGNPIGIDAWEPSNKSHADNIVKVLFKDKALTEWIYITDNETNLR